MRPLGEILIDNHIPRQYIDLALKEQKVLKKRIGEVLHSLSLAPAELIAKAIAQQSNIEFFSLFTDNVQEDIECDISFIEEYQCVPISIENGFIKVGMVDPLSTDVRDSISRYFKKISKQVIPVSISTDTFQRYLESRIKITGDEIVKSLSVSTGSDINTEKALRLLLTKAVIERASDIHIEPAFSGGKIRLRINGILKIEMVIDKQQFTRLTNMTKIASGMNIVERAMPQDGRISGQYLNDPKFEMVDFRVSSIPNEEKSGHAESIVIRVLDKRTSILPIDTLGMDIDTLKFLSQAKNKSNGIIIFTGPTGSGKTTTIYSTMATINTVERAVVTVEDPVEYRNYLWKQVQVNEKGGLTFVETLRSILRHDPDIIFCGEIRDGESAKIAFDMANTGHLVFSTLHANDSVKAVPRLQGLGVSKSMIESSVLGIVAQRLIRTLCSKCKKQYIDPDIGESFKSKGCISCNHTGYKGRTMVTEHFPFNENTYSAIKDAIDGNVIQARQQLGQLTQDIRGNAVQKVKDGITTMEEVERCV